MRYSVRDYSGDRRDLLVVQRSIEVVGRRMYCLDGLQLGVEPFADRRKARRRCERIVGRARGVKHNAPFLYQGGELQNCGVV